MLRLTNFADYAVVLMRQLAQGENTRLSAQELSTASGVPLPTVSKVLNAMGQRGLLASHRGLKGGFTLARPADEISVADIIEAVDGPIELTHCSDGSCEPDCNIADICGMRPHWARINSAVREGLVSVTLSSISEMSVGETAAVAAAGE